jgi:predicted dehydrogenase
MKRLRMAVIGVGHLGKEHARILASLPEVELVGVVDARREQAEAVALRCSTRAYSDCDSLPGRLDAAVVAVPTSDHHRVASDCLHQGISLLVEKPLATTPEQGEELVRLARTHGAVLQVGHIERFNPAFEELRRRPLQPKFILGERVGPFSGRSTDIGVVLDLMIHDLDLVLALVNAPVQEVHAAGASLLGGHEDMAHATLRFADGCVAHLTASRVHPAASRRMQLWGAEGYAGLDFSRRHLTLMQPTPQLRQWQRDPHSLDPAILQGLRTELFGRHVEMCEQTCAGGDQLTAELQDFVTCVRTGTRPRVSGEDGLAALTLANRILERIRTHAWTGAPDGPRGPRDLPAPCGVLFPSSERNLAA